MVGACFWVNASFQSIIMSAPVKDEKTADTDELTAFERFTADFQSGLNGVLYILCKEISTEPPQIIFNMTIDFLQLLSFPLTNRIDFPWSSSVIGWLAVIANTVRISTFP